MGSGSWSARDWTTYSSTAKTMSTSSIFTSRSMSKNLDPNGVTVRESRDSADNPNSTALIVALDVTGSMGIVADNLTKEGLGVLFQEVLDRKPITDPHIMFMGVGDAAYDSAPLQVSQFEADNRVIDQLNELYLEKGGGGNNTESYDLPWYFASQHTSIDCFEKRNKKGYLFTVGDEFVPAGLIKSQIQTIFGYTPQSDFDAKTLYEMACKMYHVFHVIVEEGGCYRHYGSRVTDDWRNFMGQNVLNLSDHTKLSEVIVSAIQVREGADKEMVAKSWSGTTSMVVAHAIKGMSTSVAPRGATTGVVRL